MVAAAAGGGGEASATGDPGDVPDRRSVVNRIHGDHRAGTGGIHHDHRGGGHGDAPAAAGAQPTPGAGGAVPGAVGSAPASPPGLGPAGTATVHGDAASTDTLPGRGPGVNPAIRSSITGATCSTVFIGSDGMPVALCTSYVGMHPPTPLAPTVKLFHPDTADVLAEVQLTKGALLGGVYGYLDDEDRVVVADGDRRLLAVGHERTPEGPWRMTVGCWPISPAVRGDAITGLMPAFDGRVVRDLRRRGGPCDRPAPTPWVARKPRRRRQRPGTAFLALPEGDGSTDSRSDRVAHR